MWYIVVISTAITRNVVEISLPLELVEFSSAYYDVIEYDIDLHKYDDWTEKGGDRFGLFRFKRI